MSSFEELRDQWIHDHVPSATLSLHYVFEAAENRIAALEAEQDELTAMLRLTLRHTYAASVKDEAQLGRLIDDRIAALRKWVRLTP